MLTQFQARYCVAETSFLGLGLQIPRKHEPLLGVSYQQLPQVDDCDVVATAEVRAVESDALQVVIERLVFVVHRFGSGLGPKLLLRSREL